MWNAKVSCWTSKVQILGRIYLLGDCKWINQILFLFVAYLLILNDRNIQILRVPASWGSTGNGDHSHSDSCSSSLEGKVPLRRFIKSNNEIMLLVIIENCKDSWIYMVLAAAVDETLNTLFLMSFNHYNRTSCIFKCNNMQHVCAHTHTK